MNNKKEDEIYCSECGKAIKKDFNICSYCRKELKQKDENKEVEKEKIFEIDLIEPIPERFTSFEELKKDKKKSKIAKKD